MDPGATVLTRMPSLAYCSDIDLVQLITAALLMPTAMAELLGSHPAVPATFTIRPQPLFCISGTTSRATRKKPINLRSMLSNHCWSLTSLNLIAGTLPALLTRI